MSLYAHTRHSMEDADTIATPVMSNRISPIHPEDLPPILSLSVPQMEPRFSSPHEAPIVMKSLQSYNDRLGLDLDLNQPPGETTTTTTTTQIPTTFCLDRHTFNNHMLGASSSSTAASQQLLLQIAVQMAVQVTPLVKNKLRRAFYQWYAQAQAQQQQQQQTPPVQLLHWNGHSPGFTTEPTKDATGTTRTKTIGVVHGIPNYGQTCFLNSVLQALASLECMTHYLEHLVQVQQNRRQYLQHQQLYADDDPQISGTSATVTPPLCQTLLDILHQVNGTSTTASPASSSSAPSFTWSTRRRIDPRPILRAVGQHHAQFRARYGAQVNAEQQDSQELLQAVMDLILMPSPPPPLQSPSHLSSAEYDDNNNNNNNNDKSALSLLQPSFLPVDWCGTQSTIRINDSARHPPSNEPNTISLWEGIQQRRQQQQQQLQLQKRRLLAVPNACIPAAVTSSIGSHYQRQQQQFQQPNNPQNTAASPVAPAPLLQPPEEKKQEVEDDFDDDDDDDDDDDYHGDENAAHGDLRGETETQFEAFIPDDASEDEMYQESTVVAEKNCEQDVPDFYYEKWDDDISALSKAMQIMRTTTSSITPSPLSGWCASALLCRTCRRVRPLQNTPFLDVPVVPTAVSQYFVATGSSQRHRLRLGDPPVKPGAREPPCLLEECLEDFSSIERVHDVECKNCTIQAEIREQESEKEWQEQTLRNLLRSRRSKRSSSVGSSTDGDASARTTVDADNGTEEFQHLHQELCAIDSRLELLRKIDPDGDTPIPAGHVDRNVDNDSSDFVQLKRSDAFKCLLLSRLPAVLSIHVQRRYFNPATGQESKTMQHVIFPEILDVAPYCAYGGAAVQPEAPFAGTVDPQQPSVLTTAPIRYRLVSVIEHRGGAHSGHYVCFRRDPNSDGWLWISDETVRPCDWTVVRQCQAYMLFYEALG